MVTGTGVAQTAGQGSVDAAEVEDRFRRAPKIPQVAGPFALPTPEAVGPVVEEMAFVLSEVVIKGVSVYEAADLAPL
jgi:hypothetical protein